MHFVHVYTTAAPPPPHSWKVTWALIKIIESKEHKNNEKLKIT
jgi:hypothetical protein